VKRLLRSAAVQWMLGALVAGYIEIVHATMRWELVNTEGADAAIAGPDGVIGAFWHGRIALSVIARRVLKRKPVRAMISLSRDGEFIAQAMDRMRIPAIRGSAFKARDRTKAKGGATAFRQSMAFLAEGGCVALTPDGPRGPNQVMQDGVVTLAKMSGAPVFLFGLAASHPITMKSWDRTQIPRPFTRGCVVFDGPLHIASDADEAQSEAARLDWQNRLNAAQRRAEAIVAGKGE
jgi:lysophospholipid acyltransferase (LPLAT)-like uncharacterized protein